jgi:hypothetical protein
MTTAERLRDLCVVTLPVPTIDGRLVDVFVESRVGDYYLVHDAAKAANELILNGIDITPSIREDCGRLAQAFGIAWVDEMFQFGCKITQLPATALAVAACSAYATIHLLGQVAKEDEGTVVQQFGTVLRSWSRHKARVRDNVAASGEWKQHAFDFVIHPKRGTPIGISVLSPAGNAIAAADRAAFRTKDLQNTQYGDWRMVNVQTHAETWSMPARELLRKCSAGVIEINSGERPSVTDLAEVLDRLLVA